MRKFLWIMCALLFGMTAYAGESNDTVINKSLDEFTVTSFYRNSTPMLGSTFNSDAIIANNYGQEPSWLFAKMPSIFAFSDNGTDWDAGTNYSSATSVGSKTDDAATKKRYAKAE